MAHVQCWWHIHGTAPPAGATSYPSCGYKGDNETTLGGYLSLWPHGEVEESIFPSLCSWWCSYFFAESQLFHKPSEGSSHSQHVSWNDFFHPPKQKDPHHFLCLCWATSIRQLFLLLWGMRIGACASKTSGNLVVYGKTLCHTEVIINPHPFSSSRTSWSPRSRNIWSEILEYFVQTFPSQPNAW